MKKLIKKITLFAVVYHFSFSASGVTLDYRHEYTDVHKEHKDRFLISHRFENGFGFGLEAMWKNGGEHKERAFGDLVSNGTEATISYQFVVTDKFNLQPQFVFSSSAANSGYKPGLYLSYKLLQKLSLSTRYRYEYIRYPLPGSQDEKTHRADLWINYDAGILKYEYSYFYIKNKYRLRFDNGKSDYEHAATLRYGLNKNWAPYFTVLNKSVYTTSSKRQTGYRMGLQYKF